jgi:hypothetical protein
MTAEDRGLVAVRFTNFDSMKESADDVQRSPAQMERSDMPV